MSITRTQQLGFVLLLLMFIVYVFVRIQ